MYKQIMNKMKKISHSRGRGICDILVPTSDPWHLVLLCLVQSLSKYTFGSPLQVSNVFVQMSPFQRGLPDLLIEKNISVTSSSVFPSYHLPLPDILYLLIYLLPTSPLEFNLLEDRDFVLLAAVFLGPQPMSSTRYVLIST